VLSAVRRRDRDLDVRLVNQSDSPTTARLHLPLASARVADLLGRPGPTLPSDPDGVSIGLGPWAIRTLRLERRDAS
jgi:hypothetical protein